jgi:hypothetical protein
MAKSLRNYTSEVPVSRSRNAILDRLESFGANRVMFEKEPIPAIYFELVADGQGQQYRLTIDAKAVLRAMQSDGVRGATLPQAERTAWKSVAELVELMVDLHRLRIVDTRQFLLPYAYSAELNATLYERVAQNPALLSPPK